MEPIEVEPDRAKKREKKRKERTKRQKSQALVSLLHNHGHGRARAGEICRKIGGPFETGGEGELDACIGVRASVYIRAMWCDVRRGGGDVQELWMWCWWFWWGADATHPVCAFRATRVWRCFRPTCPGFVPSGARSPTVSDLLREPNHQTLFSSFLFLRFNKILLSTTIATSIPGFYIT